MYFIGWANISMLLLSLPAREDLLSGVSLFFNQIFNSKILFLVSFFFKTREILDLEATTLLAMTSYASCTLIKCSLVAQIRHKQEINTLSRIIFFISLEVLTNPEICASASTFLRYNKAFLLSFTIFLWFEFIQDFIRTLVIFINFRTDIDGIRLCTNNYHAETLSFFEEFIQALHVDEVQNRFVILCERIRDHVYQITLFENICELIIEIAGHGGCKSNQLLKFHVEQLKWISQCFVKKNVVKFINNEYGVFCDSTLYFSK